MRILNVALTVAAYATLATTEAVSAAADSGVLRIRSKNDGNLRNAAHVPTGRLLDLHHPQRSRWDDGSAQIGCVVGPTTQSMCFSYTDFLSHYQEFWSFEHCFHERDQPDQCVDGVCV